MYVYVRVHKHTQIHTNTHKYSRRHPPSTWYTSTNNGTSIPRAARASTSNSPAIRPVKKNTADVITAEVSGVSAAASREPTVVSGCVGIRTIVHPSSSTVCESVFVCVCACELMCMYLYVHVYVFLCINVSVHVCVCV